MGALRTVVAALPLLGAGACAVPEAAAPGALVVASDRPSFSDGTGLTPVGHPTLESGITVGRDDRPGQRSDRAAAPELLLRARVLERVEARVGYGGLLWRDDAAGTADGSGDATLGIKALLQEETETLPALAIGLTTSLGQGDEDFGAGSADPVARLIWSRTLRDGFGLGGNLVVGFPNGADGRFTQSAVSVYGTYTPVVGATWFAEVFAVDPIAAGGDPAFGCDAGLLQLLSCTVQFDARVGLGLDADAEDYTAGIGLTFLF